jgi:hypothetical protein
VDSGRRYSLPPLPVVYEFEKQAPRLDLAELPVTI